MLEVLICLVGVFTLLVIDEILVHAKILKAEYRRKFAHIAVGAFVASWPWLIGWRTIQLISVLMLVVVVFNQYNPIFKFNKSLNRRSYGDYFFAIAILACSILTTSNLFFALAILHLSLADGLAALVGKNFGRKWKYKIFNQTKTVVGSMTFWIVSLLILGIGLLFGNGLIVYGDYVVLVIVLPPILTVFENISVYGLDNLVVPIAVILALGIAQSG